MARWVMGWDGLGMCAWVDVGRGARMAAPYCAELDSRGGVKHGRRKGVGREGRRVVLRPAGGDALCVVRARSRKVRIDWV